jgi:hypothetical protein
MVGKIYLSKIYFTDLSEYKIRPVLVIKELGDDCICLPLTTKTNQNGIIVSKNDLESGELKKESLIIIPKNFTLHKSILFKYLATIKTDKLNSIFAAFCQKLEC